MAFARAVRVTLVAPTLFALALEVFDSPAVATTAVFGAVSALVFSDFGGPIPSRVRAYLTLGVVGALLLALGTLVSASTAWMVPLTFVIGAGVRLSGNVGPRWSAAVSPLILAFVLGALVPAPADAIPGRMLGWGLALVLAAIASVVIMPKRSSVRISNISAESADAIARALRVALDCPDDATRAAERARVEEVRIELRVASLMPLRPSGPGARDMARRLIVDRLLRLTRLVDLALREGLVPLSDEMRAVGEHGATCLETSARVMRREATTIELARQLAERDEVRGRGLERLETGVGSGEAPETVLARIDSGFVARASSAHADTVARNVAFLARDEALAAGADSSGDVPDPSVRDAIRRVDRFLDVHARPSSVWFRDALRAGIALAVAVFVARALAVDHAFWVALGTLSVLRSSALATGQTALSAALGTGVGFGISAGLLALVGLHGVGLWIVLVIGVFGLAYLPAVAGFGAGQAAFTVTVVALFNILQPEGWHTGLARFENVAIGVLVSSVVAALFWPRRLEPLVARLVASFSAATGALLETAVRRDSQETWRSSRRQIGITESRTRAALVEMIAQHRGRPELSESWISRFGVATHTRSAADSVQRLHTVLPGPDQGSTEFDRALGDAARTLAGILEPGRGAPDPRCAASIRHQTRRAALAAIANGGTTPRAVVRSLLTRDWLIAVAETVDERP